MFENVGQRSPHTQSKPSLDTVKFALKYHRITLNLLLYYCYIMLPREIPIMFPHSLPESSLAASFGSMVVVRALTKAIKYRLQFSHDWPTRRDADLNLDFGV